MIAKNGIHTRRERSLESKETLLNIAFFIFYLLSTPTNNGGKERKTTIFSINNNNNNKGGKIGIIGLDQGNGFDLEN